MSRAAVVDAAYAEVFDNHLVPLGFAHVGGRRWVRSRVPHVMDLFEPQPTKGGLLCPTWGFSFDFVPHVRGGSVCWHRTPKSALLDVRDDPSSTLTGLDVDRLLLPTTDDRDHLLSEGAKVATRIVPLAQAFWIRVNSVDQLPALFDHLQTRRSSRLGFENWIQQPLAYAFTLARFGRPADAQQALHRASAYADEHSTVQLGLERALAAAGRDPFVAAAV